jgi:signal transduction histidine kinase
MIDILDNAFQASQGNQAKIKVAVSTDNQHVRIDVADRGIGMENKVKERFGEAFISARPGGTVLGIFTALSLLEGLGGTLQVLDRFGGGTTMRLQIPIAKDAV